MGKGSMGVPGFSFQNNPDDILQLEGKEAISALHDLAPVVTKTLQVFSEVMYKLVKQADKQLDGISLDQENHLKEVQNLEFKLQNFQTEYDGGLKEQAQVNEEWDRRMKKVEAVISGLPAWKEDTINQITNNRRSDDVRHAEVLARLAEVENSHAVLKEDAMQRLGDLEDTRHKSDQGLSSLERRAKTLEDEMKKHMEEMSQARHDFSARDSELEEQLGALKLSFSRFNHEYKVLEASHEELKNKQAEDLFRLNEQHSLAGQERASLGREIRQLHSDMADGDSRLQDRLDSLQPAIQDLEELKSELMNMRTELEMSLHEMTDEVNNLREPPPTEEPSSQSAGSSNVVSRSRKLKAVAQVAASTASRRALASQYPGKSKSGASTPAGGGVAGGLTYMMNYLKERIEGMTEHSLEQDQEIGDLQTRTGEIVLDLMRLRKTEDELVKVKTTMREHKDMIDRNKNNLAQALTRQSEEDQQIYALIEKKAAEAKRHATMDIKGASMELKSLCNSNMDGIKDLSKRVSSLTGKVKDHGEGVAAVDPESMHALEDNTRKVAELQGRMAAVEDKNEQHEQRLTDQGLQIYDISAKMLTELDKELNTIKDDIQEKTSMLQEEILLRPTEPDVKEIFTALKMGLMGETASFELKKMMEQLLQASKSHLLKPDRPLSGESDKQPDTAIPGTPDNRRVDHVTRLELSQNEPTASLISGLLEKLDLMIDRPHSCVDSLVLYTYMLTARLDAMQSHTSNVLRRLAIVQKEAATAYQEIGKLGQQMDGKTTDSKQIKRLENAVKELARLTITAHERDTVMLGSLTRDQNGEFFKCLSCDNQPVPLDELNRAAPETLPSLGRSSPQGYVGRDKLVYPDKLRAATASPEAARGRMYASTPIGQAQAWQERSGSPDPPGLSPQNSQGTLTQRAAIYSSLPTVLSTASQSGQGVSHRMESFAPYSDMPPPQFHGRGRDMRRDLTQRQNELPHIPTPSPRTGNGSPLRGAREPAPQP